MTVEESGLDQLGSDENLNASDEVRLYELLKTYAIHEDGLMNTRMNWCLLINSFLLTSVGVLSTASDKLPVIELAGGINTYFIALLATAALGLFMTGASWRGVAAAERSLHRLDDYWRFLRGGSPNAMTKALPELLGGLTPQTPDHQKRIGVLDAMVAKTYPRWMLGALVCAWGALLVGSLAALFNPSLVSFQLSG